MSSSKDSRAFRICVADVAAQLSQPETDLIVYIEELPVCYRGSQSLTVLAQLQMQGIFSSSKIDGLIQVMKGINRLDLVQKLKEYSKQAGKKRKKNEPSLTKVCDTLHATLEARLQALSQINQFLSDQLKQFVEDANEAGERRVEEVVGSAKDLIDTRVDAMLHEASTLLERRGKSASPPSSDGEETGTLERQSSDSSGDTRTAFSCTNQPLETPTSIGGNPKSSARPPYPSPKPPGPRKADPLSPILSPVNPRTVAEMYPPAVTSDRLPGKITPEQLVTGRTRLTIPRGTKKMPLLPPNPKKGKDKVTEKPTTQFQPTEVQDEDDYTCGSTGDYYTGGYTDDSGFVEARKYLRRPLEEVKPLQPVTEQKPVAYYKRLEVPTMDKIDYYATCHRTEQPSEATYEPMTREAMSLLTEDLQKGTIYQNQK